MYVGNHEHRYQSSVVYIWSHPSNDNRLLFFNKNSSKEIFSTSESNKSFLRILSQILFENYIIFAIIMYKNVRTLITNFNFILISKFNFLIILILALRLYHTSFTLYPSTHPHILVPCNHHFSPP